MSDINWSTWRSNCCFQKAICKPCITRICCMHTIHTRTLRAFMIAAIFVKSSAPLLQWEDDSNQNNWWTPTDVDCTECNCRSGHCGHRRFQLMGIMKTHKVLEMLTTSTLAHTQTSSTLAFQFLLRLLRILWRNALQSFTKQRRTECVTYCVCAHVSLVDVSSNCLTVAKTFGFSSLSV